MCKEVGTAENGHFSFPDIKSRKALQHSHHNVKTKVVRCHTAVLIVVIMSFFFQAQRRRMLLLLH